MEASEGVAMASIGPVHLVISSTNTDEVVVDASWDFTLSNEDAASGRQYREVVQLIGVDKGMPGEDGVDDVIAQISDGQVGHFDGIHYTYRHSCQHKFPATQLDEDQNPLFIRIDEIQVRVTLSSESDSNIVRRQEIPGAT